MFLAAVGEGAPLQMCELLFEGDEKELSFAQGAFYCLAMPCAKLSSPDLVFLFGGRHKKYYKPPKTTPFISKTKDLYLFFEIRSIFIKCCCCDRWRGLLCSLQEYYCYSVNASLAKFHTEVFLALQ